MDNTEIREFIDRPDNQANIDAILKKCILAYGVSTIFPRHLRKVSLIEIKKCI